MDAEDKPKTTEPAYGENQIQALEGIEGIRHRPTMYIGDDMFFGNDRLPLVEAALIRAGQ